jgi:mercuric ion transport protein
MPAPGAGAVPPGPPGPRRKRNTSGIAAVIAAVVCAAVCAAPLLLAGGLTAGLGALFTDSDFLAPVILATTAGAALLWWRHRRVVAATAAESACSPAGSCGADGC